MNFGLKTLNNRFCRFNVVKLAQRRKIPVASLSTIPSLVDIVQSSLTSYQAYTGLPWWSAFASSTIIVRFGLFPLVRLQLLTASKFAKAMPEIMVLHQLLTQRHQMGDKIPMKESIRLLGVFFKGTKAALTIHGFSIMKFFFYPAINIAAFITFAFSLRNMVVGKTSQALSDGGYSWFMDLTDKDPTYILPLLAVAITYTGVSYSFNGNKNRLVLLFQDVAQCMLLLGIPFYMQLPAGIFCYWIPSSILAIVQTKVLRTPFFQKLLGLPAPPSQPQPIANK